MVETNRISKLINKYVKRGRPSEGDMGYLRCTSPLTAEVSEQIAEKIQAALQQTDARPNTITRTGITVNAGKLRTACDVDLQVTPLGYHAGNLELGIYMPPNSWYRNSSDWHDPFTKLRMEFGGTKRNYKEATDSLLDDGKYYLFDNYRSDIRVLVDANSFLKRIGAEGLNLEVEKHKLGETNAEEMGLKHQKYLERRGDEAGKRSL